MKTIGLTGGCGMGKSTAADLMLSMGYPIVDTDEIARALVAPGLPALAEIRQRFGDGVVDAEGRLRRAELARTVFLEGDSAARRDLEAILHPRIRQAWQSQVQQWAGDGRAVGVVVIPLLFETGAEEYFESIVCVACSSATQEARLQSRGWGRAEMDRRNRAQWPISTKMERAHYVVWSEGAIDVLRDQLRRIREHWG
jgi:dephospho-CoA kinase